MTTKEAAALLRRARRVLDCRCLAGQGLSTFEPVMFWASEFEYWNTPVNGHLIGASLILDGMPATPPRQPKR